MQWHEPINKGKILGGRRETFEIDWTKQESRVEKGRRKWGRREKIDYQMMESEKFQKVNKKEGWMKRVKKKRGKVKFHRNGIWLEGEGRESYSKGKLHGKQPRKEIRSTGAKNNTTNIERWTKLRRK